MALSPLAPVPLAIDVLTISLKASSENSRATYKVENGLQV